VGQTGTPGAWAFTDTAGSPGAACKYNGGGTAGGTYLTGIRLRGDIQLWGTHPGLRSVGYRPILEHRIEGVWVQVRKGTLVTGAASLTDPLALAGNRTNVPLVPDQTSPFRLKVKLIWYRKDASVEGTRTILVQQYLRRDGGTAGRCAGFVSDL
jgi:hypothetical protein